MKSSLIDQIFKKIDGTNFNTKVFKILSAVLIILAIFIASSILFPTVTSTILNIIWILLLAVVIVFLFLGTLVIIGLKEEANKLFDVLLEGSLTLVDFIDFLKKLWKRFVQLLKEFLLYAAPALAYAVNLIIYLILLIIYKNVGKTYDVTTLTIFLTVFLITLLAVLNKPKVKSSGDSLWSLVFKERFRSGFVDGMEVLVFLFFLTMDSTKLFFLPSHLNIPLRAEFRSYDLMTRAFVYNDHLRTTLTLIIITVITELIRNVARIVYAAVAHYKKGSITFEEGEIAIKHRGRLKSAIRSGFKEARDDFIKFVTYTTFMLFVFLLFPRLKILTVAVASITSLILDMVLPHRLNPAPKSNDLLSRIIVKVFRL